MYTSKHQSIDLEDLVALRMTQNRPNSGISILAGVWSLQCTVVITAPPWRLRSSASPIYVSRRITGVDNEPEVAGDRLAFRRRQKLSCDGIGDERIRCEKELSVTK